MKINRLAIFAILIASLTSCMTARQVTYFNDMVVNDSYPVKEKPEIVLQPGDIVNISVSSSDPQLAAPFNMVEAVNMDALITDYTFAGSQNKTVLRGYELDAKGNIEFPVLGEQHLAGKTLSQVREMISSLIMYGGYIKEPIVHVDIKNFEYVLVTNSVSGIGSGTYGGAQRVDGNSMTLLKALARGNVLNSSQKLDDIRVIRTEGDVRKVYSVNILKKDFFDSPVFWLQQNDIIYVKPRGGSLTPEAQFVWTMIGTGLSAASLAGTMAVLFYNVTNNKD